MSVRDVDVIIVDAGPVGVSLDDVAAVKVEVTSVRYASGARAHRREGLGRVVRRAEFDHALVRRAQLRGVEVRDGEGVRAIRETTAGVEVETAGGAWRARALVGGDGVGRYVRRWMGLPHGDLHAHAVEVDTEVCAGDLADDTLHFDGSDPTLPGYAWDFPTPMEGRVMRCRGVYARSRPGCAGPRASEVEARLAAGIDPIAGEGIAQALEYGKIAADFLADRVATRDALTAWREHFARSRLGVDLALRERAAPVLHGAARGMLERAMLATPWGLAATSYAFAG